MKRCRKDRREIKQGEKRDQEFFLVDFAEFHRPDPGPLHDQYARQYHPYQNQYCQCAEISSQSISRTERESGNVEMCSMVARTVQHGLLKDDGPAFHQEEAVVLRRESAEPAHRVRQLQRIVLCHLQDVLVGMKVRFPRKSLASRIERERTAEALADGPILPESSRSLRAGQIGFLVADQ